MSDNQNLEPQEILEESTMTRVQRQAAEDAKHRKLTRYYIAGTILLLVLSLAAVVWNSGYFQKNTTAAVVGGEHYTVAQLSYYYYNEVAEASYYAYYGMSTYDSTVAADQQMYSDTQSYKDYFLEGALSDLQSTHALVTAANEAGFTVDDDTMASEIESAMTSLKTEAAAYGLSSVEAYLQGYVSQYMTLDIYEDILRDQVLAYTYVTDVGDNIVVSDDALDAYYQENKDTLDTYDISYMVLLATEPTAEDGEELTDEELAAGLEESRVAMEADAYEILAALENGDDFMTLGEDYEVYGAYEDDSYIGSALNTSFSEWVMEEGRQDGDLTVATYESTDRYVYYVVRYQDRYQDNAPTANIRHVFVSAGAAPTQDEYDTAYDTAVGVLEQWEAGDATAESFGELATLYSADSSSSADGGALANVSTTSGYVDSFTDWCLDESRTPGETGLVINEGSSLKGWHLMYFESWEPALWQVTAENALVTDEITVWYDALLASVDAELGDGIKYVG